MGADWDYGRVGYGDQNAGDGDSVVGAEYSRVCVAEALKERVGCGDVVRGGVGNGRSWAMWRVAPSDTCSHSHGVGVDAELRGTVWRVAL